MLSFVPGALPGSQSRNMEKKKSRYTSIRERKKQKQMSILKSIFDCLAKATSNEIILLKHNTLEFSPNLTKLGEGKYSTLASSSLPFSLKPGDRA